MTISYKAITATFSLTETYVPGGIKIGGNRTVLSKTPKFCKVEKSLSLEKGSYATVFPVSVALLEQCAKRNREGWFVIGADMRDDSRPDTTVWTVPVAPKDVACGLVMKGDTTIYFFEEDVSSLHNDLINNGIIAHKEPSGLQRFLRMSEQQPTRTAQPDKAPEPTFFGCII